MSEDMPEERLRISEDFIYCMSEDSEEMPDGRLRISVDFILWMYAWEFHKISFSDFQKNCKKNVGE